MHQHNINTAQNAIHALVCLLVGKRVSIVWGQGASCAPDGTLSLPRPKSGAAEEIALLTRQAVHEAGHHTETDFSALEGLSESETALLQCLEDPRMESVQVQKYPGASIILNRGLESTLRNIMESLNEDHADLRRTLMVNIIIQAFLKMAPHEAMRALGPEIVARTGAHFDERIARHISVAVDALADCEDTHDVAALARKLWSELKEPPPDEQPNQGSDQTGGGVGPQGQQDPAPGEPEPETGPPHGVAPQAAEQSGEKLDSPKSGLADSDAADAEKESQTEDQASDGQSLQSEVGEDDGAPSSQGQATGKADGSDGAQGLEAEGTKAPEKAPVDLSGLDLSEVAGEDFGTQLQRAYEAIFGTPDVDDSDEGAGEDPSSVSEAMVQAVGAALEQFDPARDDLDQVIEAVLAKVGEVEQDDQGHPGEAAEQLDDATLILDANKANGNGAPRAIHDVRLNGVVSRLVRVFLSELQDKRRRSLKYARAGGQIAADRVWRLKRLGDTKIFRTRTPTSGIDAAVTVLLDRSGSMEQSIVQAAQASLACVQAFERISKVQTSIEMFPGFEFSDDSLHTLQSFGQSARQVAKRCTTVDAGGGTPLAQALGLAVPVLMERRCEKRLMLVITDGMPDSPIAASYQLANARAQGIEVIGIGMGDSCAIASLIPNSVHIKSVDELPEALERLFSTQVMQRLAA